MRVAPDEFQYFATLLEKHAGIMLEAGKEYLVEARLAAVARDQGYPSVGALLQNLRQTVMGRAHWQAIEALTTNETSFFRDEHPFNALREVILPELIARRASSRSLNIWCAAASTGQEPFSLAMLLRDSFPQLLGWNLSFLATDLSDPARRRFLQLFQPGDVGFQLGQPIVPISTQVGGQAGEVGIVVDRPPSVEMRNLPRGSGKA